MAGKIIYMGIEIEISSDPKAFNSEDDIQWKLAKMQRDGRDTSRFVIMITNNLFERLKQKNMVIIEADPKFKAAIDRMQVEGRYHAPQFGHHGHKKQTTTRTVHTNHQIASGYGDMDNDTE